MGVKLGDRARAYALTELDWAGMTNFDMIRGGQIELAPTADKRVKHAQCGLRVLVRLGRILLGDGGLSGAGGIAVRNAGRGIGIFRVPRTCH